MCGACVRVRRCSSASLGSGTARKRASVAASAAESRKPKMGWGLVEGDSLPPTTARREGNKTAEERNTTKKNRMGSRCESKYGNTASQDRLIRQNWLSCQAYLTKCTCAFIFIFVTKITIRCYNENYEASHHHLAG